MGEKAFILRRAFQLSLTCVFSCSTPVAVGTVLRVGGESATSSGVLVQRQIYKNSAMFLIISYRAKSE